jgi:hypothetical protein
MRPTRRAAAVGLTAVVLALAVAFVASRHDGRRTLTDHGIQWAIDGSGVVITATEKTPPSARARLRGRLVVACEGPDGPLGARGEGLGLGSVRFRVVPQTVRVPLSPPLREIAMCALERPGIADNISFVRFAPDPVGSDSDELLIIK